MRITILAVTLSVVFLYFVFFFPFLVSAYGYVNLKHKFGIYCVKFIGIRIICGRCFLKGTKVVFENENNLIKLKNKNLSKTVKLAIYLIYRFMDIISIAIAFCCGDKENPAKAALFCGSAHVFFGSTFSVLKAKNKRASFKKYVEYVSDKDCFTIMVKSHAAICLFDVFKSFVFARIEASKSVQTKSEVKHG